MYCKHCGKEIADDSTFCNYCGGKQSSTNQNIHNDDDTTAKIEVSPIKVEVYKRKQPKEPITINKTAIANKLTACFKEFTMIVLTACIGFIVATFTWGVFVGSSVDGRNGEETWNWVATIVILAIIIRYIVILIKWVNKNQSKQES